MLDAYILPLDGPQGDLPGLEEAGGKGLNLARIRRTGFPVPAGFVLRAGAYREYVTANRLEGVIAAQLAQAGGESASKEDFTRLEAASAAIRAAFAAGRAPEGMAAALQEAYRSLGAPPVAVRSSATAEDLPELSFAGQQDTFLNVTGEKDLLAAVVKCWGSLWTARAIGYRRRSGISSETVALAVVVQEMVSSRAAGVMFTANPLTGLRSETVIEATLGLGEALVSGQVEPDGYAVEPGAGQILSKTLGAKAVAVRPQAGGGTHMIAEDGREQQALPDEAILELARLGKRVEAEFGSPQDIEWAWGQTASSGEGLHLLQARAITSLFPTPKGLEEGPLKAMFSFASVQGMLDPITPIGQEALKRIFAAGAGLLGMHVTHQTQAALYSAGERLWVNVTPILKNRVGRKVFNVAMGYIDPAVSQAVAALGDEPRLQPEGRGLRPRTVLNLARLFLPLAWNVACNLRRPAARREAIVRQGELILQRFQKRLAEAQGDRYARLRRQAQAFAGVMEEELPRAFLLFVSGVASGMASFTWLRVLAGRLPGRAEAGQAWDERALEATRGLPNNPTTAMDLALWDVARRIQADPAGRAAFLAGDAAGLAGLYLAGDLPPSVQEGVAGFLEAYGGRGLAEIDLGRPRWREEPAPVFAVLSGYLQVDRPEQAPDVLFARGAAEAEAAVAEIAAALARTRHGWLKARAARFAGGRMRQLMGLRESPKFFAVRMMAALRFALLDTGAEFVRLGELDQAGDLFFLTLGELAALTPEDLPQRRAEIACRRQAYQRELLRRQVPRLLLSDGRAFYDGLASAAEEPAGGAETPERLAGSPVSPGVAEGLARVVFDPRQAHLAPGEILVCPGTDPSWTPLFLMAAGLVMEVGGMMTHGAVVAREYGIPAVVGVDRATTRLQTGRRIRVDGTRGVVEIVR